ncbi:MAG: phosphohistidine phosphatase SixA [Proteobacteria bacterium]|nr:phosphohistidine phosphatase SixA [Pseudomonadota bacterium]
MALYLVQHGRSLSKAQDPEKGLSPQGEVEVRRMGEVASGYGVSMGEVVHSGAKRARQTAEILASLLGTGEPRKISGIAPMDEPEAFAAGLPLDPDLLVVSHLPFLDRLTGLLVAGDPDRSVFLFQKSGILCLDQHPDGENWVIRWTLMPNIG